MNLFILAWEILMRYFDGDLFQMTAWEDLMAYFLNRYRVCGGITLGLLVVKLI
jgi:hypothetical protein